MNTTVLIRCATCELPIRVKADVMEDTAEVFFYWVHVCEDGEWCACNVATDSLLFPEGSMATHPNGLSAVEWVKVIH